MKKLLRLYALPLHIMVRPFNGFYAMKYENKGTIWLALFNFLMVSISISFRAQYSSVVVNPGHPLAINSLLDLLILTGAVVLFCTANWAVTSLTDGEGKFKEIFMTVCYAMTPIVLLFIPASLLSNVLTYEEGAFYTMIIGVAIFWFVILVFAGLVTIHNYSAGKAVTTVLLTFVSLLVIVFLLTLLLTLLQQLFVFANSIYLELIFRT